MIYDDLLKILPADAIRADEPLSAHTSFEIGGPADFMLWPSTAPELAAIFAYASEHELPIFILGNGSNLLVSDRGMEGLVVNTARFDRLEVADDHITVGAGVLLKDLSYAAAEAGLTGLEFACGIPGSLGGAVFMNAGAYEGEMKDVIESVTVMDPSGCVYDIPAEDMHFHYRYSRLKDEPLVCLAATLRLAPGNPVEIESTIAELTERRESRQPLELPSAGSTFKRPPGHYAGPLIIEAGYQGHQIGGAQISLKHAGFIVNQGGATAKDVLDLIAAVQDGVEAKSGVRMEPEVRMVGRPMDE